MPQPQRNKILDPEGPLIWTYEWIMRIASSIYPFVDPLFFYVLGIDNHNKCLRFNDSLAIVVSVLRSVIDFLYFPSLIIRFMRLIERLKAQRPLPDKRLDVALLIFLFELYAFFPVLQLHFLEVHPFHSTPTSLMVMTFLQFGCRLYWWCGTVILGLATGSEKDVNLFYKWLPTTANSIYYCTLASHVVGAFWYLLSINSELRCWRHELNINPLHFDIRNVTCRNLNPTEVSRLNSSCSFVVPNETFDYGIFIGAITSHVVQSSTNFFAKLLYCFWWCLRNLSSFGQNLEPSTDLGEIALATTICFCSLVFFTLLLRNVQKFDQFCRKNFEEKRTKKCRIEAWMSRKNIPERLRERIRQLEDHKWKNTRLIDEQTLILDLPRDIRRDVKRHLYSALLIKVPQFETMNSYLLDVLCERLKPILYLKETCIFREGEPIEEMIFIKQGNLEIKAINGRRPDVFTSSNLKDGDFCGEEIVKWALDPNPSSYILPVSTRTVETISDVEAYALTHDDLKFVASQRHAMQTYQSSRLREEESRTWAAGKIQKAWCHYRKTKTEQSLSAREGSSQSALVLGVGTPSPATTTELLPVWEKGEASNSSAAR